MHKPMHKPTHYIIKLRRTKSTHPRQTGESESVGELHHQCPRRDHVLLFRKMLLLGETGQNVHRISWFISYNCK